LIFVDEDVLFAFEPAGWGRTVVTATLNRLLENRGTNPGGLASFNAETAESAFFDVLGTDEVEVSQEIAIMALVETLEELTAAQRRPGEGGFGTPEQSEWLWGLRHQVKFESILSGVAGGNPLIDLIAGDFSINTERLPLAESFEEGDPRRGLQWFPRPGDLFGVDAANPSFFGDDYHHTAGPVMRMVVRLGPDGVSGQNIIPGGQSGITESEHFDDQAALWLGNQTLPLRHTPADVAAGATGREVLNPR
jgi:acyl-homoserine lactone acylase PvdQ